MRNLEIIFALLLILSLIVCAVGCAEEVAPTPTPTPTPALKPTPALSQTPTPRSTFTPTPVPTTIWSDGRLGIRIDKVTRTDNLPSDIAKDQTIVAVWDPLATPKPLPTPRYGNEFVSVYLTFVQIEYIHIVSPFVGYAQEESSLYDTKNREYETVLRQFNGIRFLDPHDITSPCELVEGATGYLVFEMPKNEKASKLRLPYSYKESWEQTSPSRGVIEIGLSY